MRRISRRSLLAGAAGAAGGCGRRRGSGVPGYLVAANRDGDSVAVIDLMRFTVAGRMRVDGAPGAVAGHPEQPLAYVLCRERGIVYEIDAARQQVRRRLGLGGPARGMRLAPDGRSLWLSLEQRPALVEVPVESFRPSARVRLPAPAEDFDISRDGVLGASFRGEGTIGLAAAGAKAIETTVPAGAEPSILRFQSDGRQLLAGNRGARSLRIFDVRRGRQVVHLPLAVDPTQFCFSADGGQLFVSGPGRDAVAIVFPYSTEVAETILAGRQPESMATCAAPPYLFVSNPGSGSVTVLDIDTRRLVAVAVVGQEPGQILVTPDNQYALVLNRGSGDVAVLRIGTLRTEADGKPRRYTSPPLFTLIPVGPHPVSAAIVPA